MVTFENARHASEPQSRQAPPSPKADLESGQKNRPFRDYSDAGIRCFGANLLPVGGHIRPVRDGLDREAKRGWLCTRPSVQRSIDIINLGGTLSLALRFQSSRPAEDLHLLSTRHAWRTRNKPRPQSTPGLCVFASRVSGRFSATAAEGHDGGPRAVHPPAVPAGIPAVPAGISGIPAAPAGIPRKPAAPTGKAAIPSAAAGVAREPAPTDTGESAPTDTGSATVSTTSSTSAVGAGRFGGEGERKSQDGGQDRQRACLVSETNRTHLSDSCVEETLRNQSQRS